MARSVQDIMPDLPAEPKLLCLDELFGGHGPVEVEIGCGKGGFLLEQARQHGDRNYIGVEWSRPYFLHAADRMARWGLDNVRILRADARVLLQHGLPESCLAGLHVYHPDPWPKRRHHKRRLFCPDFVNAVARVLQDGALLSVQSDHAPYFEVIAALVQAQPELVEVSTACYRAADEQAGVSTNYQTKYRREGRDIHHLTCTRRPRREL